MLAKWWSIHKTEILYPEILSNNNVSLEWVEKANYQNLKVGRVVPTLKFGEHREYRNNKIKNKMERMKLRRLDFIGLKMNRLS